MSIIQRRWYIQSKRILVTEITVKNETFSLTCLYRSFIQNRKQFQPFCNSLDILMNYINSFNPAFSIITGDFKGKRSKWCSFEIENNGKELDIIISTAGYTQIIEKPTHFTNHSSSCIWLIFTSNSYYTYNSGIRQWKFSL